MHDVMLVLVVVAVIIALAIVATVLAIAVAVMVVFVLCLVAGMVTAFMASMAVVMVVAVSIVTIILIIREGMMLISTSRLRTAFVWFLGAHFLGSLLGFLLLELIECAIRLISILALLKEADECNVVVGQHFMSLRIFLQMLPWH